jgi:hypothetical protein
VTRTEYGVKVTALIDEQTGGFEYPDSFESDVGVCFLQRLSPEAAAEQLLTEYRDGSDGRPQLILTAKTDLRNWVDSALGADGTPAMVAAVTDWIQGDSNRPDWGSDWRGYLDGLDLWHVVTGLQL